MTPGFPVADGDGKGDADGGAADGGAAVVVSADPSRSVTAGDGVETGVPEGVGEVPQPAMPVRASRDSS
ncbi:hypothetical protein Q0Z83_109510 [Actinoplanes sichuanensis]|nr:hypothetical protein Q0Z83_109510 [Actinoplanes sichuanensis]